MEIITMTRELGKAIQDSPEYQALTNAKIANDSDSELNNMIGEFNLKKTEIEQIMNSEHNDQEIINQKNGELREIYQEIMSNPNMIAFNKTSEAMNTMMSYINNILIATVNGENPETCDINPQSDCCSSGGCSSCSGCN